MMTRLTQHRLLRKAGKRAKYAFHFDQRQRKDVSSRDGMRRTVETSSYYSGWLESTPHDLKS